MNESMMPKFNNMLPSVNESMLPKINQPTMTDMNGTMMSKINQPMMPDLSPPEINAHELLYDLVPEVRDQLVEKGLVNPPPQNEKHHSEKNQPDDDIVHEAHLDKDSPVFVYKNNLWTKPVHIEDGTSPYLF
jgi:hypothetical protein